MKYYQNKNSSVSCYYNFIFIGNVDRIFRSSLSNKIRKQLLSNNNLILKMNNTLEILAR
jgi:hypothetical protein